MSALSSPSAEPTPLAVETTAIAVEIAAPACPSCDAALVGEFCHRCGEANPAMEDRSLRHFFREAASEVGDLDSKLARTYRALLARPGFLTLEYLAGRRKGYLGPLKTFLLVFAAMLFTAILVERYAPGAQGGDAASGFFERRIDDVVGAVARRQDVPAVEARRLLMEAIQKRLSWFSVLVPLLFGVVTHAVFRGRRRWFTENLVFATHFAAFNYLVGLLLMPLQIAMQRAGNTGMGVISILIFVVMTAYLVRSVRRVYPGSKWGRIPGSFALLLGFSVCQGIVSVLAIAAAVGTLLYL